MTALEGIQDLAKELNTDQQELILELIINMLPNEDVIDENGEAEPYDWEIESIKEWEAMSPDEKSDGAITIEELAEEWDIAL